MKHTQVKVRLKENITDADFWKATYHSNSNLGIELLPNFANMKKEYLDGKLSAYGALEVTIPISYYDKNTKTIIEDNIQYNYIQDSKKIWEIVDFTPLHQSFN